MSSYDVVKDYPWCINTDDTELINECPKITVQFHKLKDIGSVRKIKSLVSTSGESGKKYYDSLYDTEKESTFVFPYFDGVFLDYKNKFSDKIQTANFLDNKLNEAVDAASKVLQGYETGKDLAKLVNKYASGDPSSSGTGRAIYIETPQYQNFGINGGDIQVDFMLLNTNSAKGYDKNIQLIKELAKLNKPTRKNSVLVEPVKICKIRIHGYREVPWAYCNKITVEGLGTKRMVGSGILPEAYKISMAFTPLVMEDVTTTGVQ